MRKLSAEHHPHTVFFISILINVILCYQCNLILILFFYLVEKYEKSMNVLRCQFFCWISLYNHVSINVDGKYSFHLGVIIRDIKCNCDVALTGSSEKNIWMFMDKLFSGVLQNIIIFINFKS